MMRTSTRSACSPPSAADARASRGRAAAWAGASSGSSPISSRNSVPPCACSNTPAALSTAPVNAPTSWPNSSLSNRLLGDRAAVDDDERLVARAASARGSRRRRAPCRCRSRPRSARVASDCGESSRPCRTGGASRRCRRSAGAERASFADGGIAIAVVERLEHDRAFADLGSCEPGAMNASTTRTPLDVRAVRRAEVAQRASRRAASRELAVQARDTFASSDEVQFGAGCGRSGIVGGRARRPCPGPTAGDARPAGSGGRSPCGAGPEGRDPGRVSRSGGFHGLCMIVPRSSGRSTSAAE